MSDAEAEAVRRSRRSKKNVNYAREQDFSDDDIFEDSPAEEPMPKRGRPKSSSSARKPAASRRKSAAAQDEDELLGDDNDDDFRPNKPIYTEKGYDPSLPPIRERFSFLPEFEPDGSPRIDLIVGRRPVDENADEAKGSDEENQDPDDDEDDNDSDEEGAGRRKNRRRGGGNNKKQNEESPAKQDKAGVIEYEYLVKYKNRSYLHLEWKTGADLESMNKSAKTIYRRYLKKLALGLDEDLENPEFDPSYVVPQKIVAEKEQELTLELSDKELLKWEKEREKELAEESDDDDDEKEGEEKDKTDEKDSKPKGEEAAETSDDKKPTEVEEKGEDKKGTLDSSARGFRWCVSRRLICAFLQMLPNQKMVSGKMTLTLAN